MCSYLVVQLSAAALCKSVSAFSQQTAAFSQQTAAFSSIAPTLRAYCFDLLSSSTHAPIALEAKSYGGSKSSLVAESSLILIYDILFVLQQPMMSNQPCRSNMVSPGARQILSRENSLSPLPQQQLQWHTPQINANNSNKHVPTSQGGNVSAANDDSFKITLPPTRSKPSITPPSIGKYNIILLVCKA